MSANSAWSALCRDRCRQRRGTIVVEQPQSWRQRAFQFDAPLEARPFGELARKAQQPAAGACPELYRKHVRRPLAATFECDGAEAARDNRQRKAIQVRASVEIGRPPRDPERSGLGAEAAVPFSREAASLLHGQPGHDDFAALPHFGSQFQSFCRNAEQARSCKVEMQRSRRQHAEAVKRREIGVERQVLGRQPRFEPAFPPAEPAFDPGAVDASADLLECKIGAFEPRPQRIRRDAVSGQLQPALRPEVAEPGFLHGARVDPEPGQQGAQILRFQRKGGAVMPVPGYLHLRSTRQRGGELFHRKPARVAAERRLDPSRRPFAGLHGAGVQRESQACARRRAGKLRQTVPPAIERQHGCRKTGVDRRAFPPVRPYRAGEALVVHHRIDGGELCPVGTEPDLCVERAFPPRRGLPVCG